MLYLTIWYALRSERLKVCEVYVAILFSIHTITMLLRVIYYYLL